MCTFLISGMRQAQYCRPYSIPLCDQMNAILKLRRFPRSRCFQIGNTGSKLEENIGISQITQLSIVNWAIIMCNVLIFAYTLGHGMQTRRNPLRVFLFFFFIYSNKILPNIFTVYNTYNTYFTILQGRIPPGSKSPCLPQGD